VQLREDARDSEEGDEDPDDQVDVGAQALALPGDSVALRGGDKGADEAEGPENRDDVGLEGVLRDGAGPVGGGEREDKFDGVSNAEVVSSFFKSAPFPSFFSPLTHQTKVKK
jgi:hypothetical protein